MTLIQKLDFIGIPSQDAVRARSFYRDVLGMRPDEHAEYEQWAGSTCFAVWEPERVGMEFIAQTGNPLPLRVEDVHAARAELDSKGVTFFATPSTPASATWRSSRTPMATSSCCTAATHRTKTRSRLSI